jgi:cyclophilin family peptidyl-prolyl cis-trans isomerase
MPTDKRARQKENRSAALAQRQAEERRRKTIRWAFIIGALALIVVMAILTGGKETGDKNKNPAAASSNSPSASAATDAVACKGPQPPEAEPKEYKEKPELKIKPGVDYSAVIDTSCGEVKIDLNEDNPQNVANFIFLAKEGFYNGLIWHRVELDAVIQTGDPDGINGHPPDGPGYTIPDELPSKGGDYVYGVVGMANTGAPDSAGSQFFIVTHDSPANREDGKKAEPAGYPPNYSILGRVDPSSYDVIDTISTQKTNTSASDPAEAVKPIVPVYINSIEIIES